MQVVSRASEVVTRGLPVSVAIGMFDGVHLGHQRLLRLAIDDARDRPGLAVAVTFDRHPNAIVAPHQTPPSLQTIEHRLALLRALGLDAVVLIPFDAAFSRIQPETFIRHLARDLGEISTVCVGQGFTFGHHRSGNVSLLQSLGLILGYTTHELSAVCLNGVPIRSTRIREHVAQGELEAAGTLLGRPYSVAGRVVHGDHLGRQLGVATANLDLAHLLLPPHGVYAAYAVIEAVPRPAILNIGVRPTLNQPKPSRRIETHVLDFEGELYDRLLEVIPLAHLRPERKFPSLEALRQQIQTDIAQARTELARRPPPML